MKPKKIFTASEMGKLGVKARLKKLGGKKAYSKAMTEAINKRWAKVGGRKPVF